MRSLNLAIAILIPSITHPAAGCLEFGPAVTTLMGKLSEEIFPGLPNFGSIASGDAADRILILTLDEAICVAGREGEDSPEASSREDILRVQVVPEGDELEARLQQLRWLRIEVTGTLFAGITGAHRTQVLIWATAANASP
jgi:hypothetical protein